MRGGIIIVMVNDGSVVEHQSSPVERKSGFPIQESLNDQAIEKVIHPSARDVVRQLGNEQPTNATDIFPKQGLGTNSYLESPLHELVRIHELLIK